MNFRRVIIGFYLALFVGVGVASTVFFWQTRQQYNHLKQIESDYRRRLAQLEDRLAEQERILERLRTDPDYVERVIRLRLGYAKPHEYIFRFEDAR